MIGVYDYTVLATYLSLLLGLSGIYLSAQGDAMVATLCLMLCGLLDAFDGRIARTKPNRTDVEKRFGIQIDSLNDLVCFGVLPAAIGCALGCTKAWFLASMAFFVLCALIRLAYFNVLEEERQSGTDAVRHHYLGLPVTSVSFLAPLVCILNTYVGKLDLAVAYCLALLVFGVLFITPLRVRKPGFKGIIALAVLGAVELVLLLLPH